MNLYLISQKENTDYDTYDSYVVVAKNKNDAKTVVSLSEKPFGDWAYTRDAIEVELIGTARRGLQKSIILGSFNAG